MGPVNSFHSLTRPKFVRLPPGSDPVPVRSRNLRARFPWGSGSWTGSAWFPPNQKFRFRSTCWKAKLPRKIHRTGNSPHTSGFPIQYRRALAETPGSPSRQKSDSFITFPKLNELVYFSVACPRSSGENDEKFPKEIHVDHAERLHLDDWHSGPSGWRIHFRGHDVVTGRLKLANLNGKPVGLVASKHLLRGIAESFLRPRRSPSDEVSLAPSTSSIFKPTPVIRCWPGKSHRSHRRDR